MTLLDSAVAIQSDVFASVPYAGLTMSNTATTTVSITVGTSTAPRMSTADSNYNPKMVERLLRQKKGRFVTAPAGEEAFLKWLERP